LLAIQNLQGVPCLFFSPPPHDAKQGLLMKEVNYIHIIQHQLGFIHVIRPILKSGDAESFCSLTAGMAIAAEYAW
jgi:hypothetical protein